jgi:probable HAF family extracellular repeat protein
MGLLPPADAMNNAGTMVTWMNRDDALWGVPVAVSRTGQVSYLDCASATGGEATGINDAGYIVGSLSNPSGWGMHACLWHGDDVIDIGTFGGTWSAAIAINNHNQVVGVYGDNENGIGNFIWTLNGGTVLIPSSPSLDDSDFGPMDINDNGLVLGRSRWRAHSRDLESRWWLDHRRTRRSQRHQ